MFFLFDDTATAAIYTLSLHDALPIYGSRHPGRRRRRWQHGRDPQRGRGIRHRGPARAGRLDAAQDRSEEHTSELQSRENLVCRLLLEKKKHEVNTQVERYINTELSEA